MRRDKKQGDKNIEFLFWLTEEEKRKLEQMSQATGLYQSSLLRKMIMEKNIESKPNPETRDLVRTVERIGNEVHQIMHLAGKTEQVSKEKIEETEQLIRELKEEVRKWL